MGGLVLVVFLSVGLRDGDLGGAMRRGMNGFYCRRVFIESIEKIIHTMEYS